MRGRERTTLADVWREEPAAYLGTTVTGFPNLFLLIGPNTGLGHTSMIYMIESQIGLHPRLPAPDAPARAAAVEPRAEVQAAYNEEIQRRMQRHRLDLWLRELVSGRWWGNTTLWPGFTAEYRWRTHRFDSANYLLTADRAAT